MDEELMRYPAMVELARLMLGRGEDIQNVLEALREKSPSIIQSMKVVRDVLKVPMNEAKDLVHHSRAWSDIRDDHSEFHAQAEAVEGGQVTQNADGSFRVTLDLIKGSSPES
jgi:predicted acyltransferase (DUF342 family)